MGKKIMVEIPRELGPVINGLSDLMDKVDALPDARGLEQAVHEGVKAMGQKVMSACVEKKADVTKKKRLRR